MTNEELKKLENYSYQISTFALTMQDEALTMGHLAWQKYALDLLAVTLKMDEAITQEKHNKISVVM